MATSSSMSKFLKLLENTAAKSFGTVLFTLCFFGGVVVGSPYVLLRFWKLSFLALVVSIRQLIMIKEPLVRAPV